MSSYFVAAASQEQVAVHDRSRCPPGSFRQDGTEYLGEFLDPSQAIAVARLRYVHAHGCPCCDGAALQGTPLAGGSMQASAHP